MGAEKNKLEEYLKSLGKLVSQYRKEREFSLEELGFRIGIDRSSMHRIEGGQNLTIATIIKLSLALDKKPGDFLKLDFDFKSHELGGLVKSKKSPKKKPALKNRAGAKKVS